MNQLDIDALILCGGEGTRIRDYLPPGLPKCLADINGTPFVAILEDHLQKAGFERFIYCTGYGHQEMSKFVGPPGRIVISWRTISHEDEVMGTGGAVAYALEDIQSDPFIAVNGDTLCEIDFRKLLEIHILYGCDITIAIDFLYRNVGVYVLSKKAIRKAAEVLGPKFNLDDAAKIWPANNIKINWYFTDAKYWDIGTPEGLEKFRCLRKDQQAVMA